MFLYALFFPHLRHFLQFVELLLNNFDLSLFFSALENFILIPQEGSACNWICIYPEVHPAQA